MDHEPGTSRLVAAASLRFRNCLTGHHIEDGGFQITESRRLFCRGAAVLPGFKQSELLALPGAPRLKLETPQFANALPVEGVAIDDNHIELTHGGGLTPRLPQAALPPAIHAANPPRAGHGRRR